MKKKLICIAILMLLITTTLSGCIDNDNNLEKETVIDIRGREIIISEEITSIIALGACSLRIISYFDSIDKIIAVDMQEKTDTAMFGGGYFESSTYRIAFPELRELPSIGSPSSVNVEAIIEQDPDIVFSSATDVSILNNLQQSLGIPVVAINADLEMDDEDFFNQITIVGKILSEEKRAEELNNELYKIIQDLFNRAENVTEKRMAYVAGMFFYGGGGLLKTSGDYLPFNFTGVHNVMPSSTAGVGKQPYDTDIETLIEKNPKFIFIDSITEHVCRDDYYDYRALLDENVRAFANQSVYTTLVYKNYGTNWENQVINMYYIGSIIYSELYEDINIEEKAEEIWHLFFQKKLDFEDTIEKMNGPGLSKVDWW
ncbi:MAG: ABC transporter substrate-binding protein [Thermoplasmatota archaeon]